MGYQLVPRLLCQPRGLNTLPDLSYTTRKWIELIIFYPLLEMKASSLEFQYLLYDEVGACVGGCVDLRLETDIKLLNSRCHDPGWYRLTAPPFLGTQLPGSINKYREL